MGGVGVREVRDEMIVGVVRGVAAALLLCWEGALLTDSTEEKRGCVRARRMR